MDPAVRRTMLEPVNHPDALLARPSITFCGCAKEKTRRWERRVRFFLIGVYGFKYAAWLLLLTLEGAERFVLIVQPIYFLVLLLSCSSITFSNLTEAFANSHRFLFGYALISPPKGQAD